MRNYIIGGVLVLVALVALIDSIWLAKAAVFVITFVYVASSDVNKFKNKLDDVHKPFFWSDYWANRWDDLIPVLSLSLLGAILAPEVGVLAFHYLMENYLPNAQVNLAETTLDLTMVAACTYYIPRYVLKKRDAKNP